VAPDTWLCDSVPMPKMRDPLTVAALPGDGRLLDDDPVVVGGKEDDGVRNLAGLADEGRAARGAGASVVGSRRRSRQTGARVAGTGAAGETVGGFQADAQDAVGISLPRKCFGHRRISA
jgi:hypothetical protein